jgi:hypothetical protein
MELWNAKYTFLLLLLIFIAIRLAFVNNPFWGLEYEDSYIYNVSSRIFNKVDIHPDPFKTKSCLFGSINDCKEVGTYSGHLISFSLLLAPINIIFGYSPNNIFVVNLVISVLLVLIVFVWSNSYSGTFSKNRFILIMLLCPFLSIFHTSGLAETISSFFVILTVLSFYSALGKGFKVKQLQYWLTILLLLCAILLKRENLILLSMFPIYYLFNYFKKRKEAFNLSFAGLFIMGLCASTGIILISGIFYGENNEAKEIGMSTFSLQYFISNFKILLVAMFTFKYWGIIGAITILTSIIIWFRLKTINLFGLICFILGWCYIAIYSFHYRSYYQVHFNDVVAFDTLRYSVNYFPLFALALASIDLTKPISRLSNPIKVSISLCFLIIIGLSTLLSFKTRIDLSSDEYYSRIEPVQKTLKKISIDDIIITDIPMVFYCYGSVNQYIVDYYSLRNEKLEGLLHNNEKKKVFFLTGKRDNERYNMNLKLSQLNGKEIDLGLEHYSLIQLN